MSQPQNTATGPAAGAVPATPYASASLYVGDLAPDVGEALLFEIFNAVGPVASVRVCRDAATRRSLGYSYVNFHRVEDAERALDTMNFKNIKAKPCRIMWSHRDPSLRKSNLGNIFVKNLDETIDNKSLYDTFSMFGNILSCKVATDAKGQSRGYGFVHYETEEAAQKAIQRVDGKIISGKKVLVAGFKSKKERGGDGKQRFTNVYVKNLPLEWSKEKMDEIFGKFGVVTSSDLKMDQKENKSKGFGFINFATADEASAAVNGLHDHEVDGKKLYVSRAQKKEERERELRDQFDRLRADRQRKFAGVNLYVKNLGDDVDDAKLRQAFAEFGAISSAKVMRDTAQKSRGFGFVCFSTPDEATKAVTEVNGRMLDGKPLYVALAQRKDVRRSQLEAQHAARQRNQVGGGMPMPQQMYAPQGPMYFPGPGMRPQAMMYPPQQMGMGPRGGGGRWNPNQQGGQVPMMQGPGMQGGMPAGVRPPPAHMNYQLMPMNGGGRGGGGGAGVGGPGGRGGRGGFQRGRGGPAAGGPGGRGGGPGGRGGAQGGAGGQNFKYADNVRNSDQQAQQTPQQQQPGAAAAATNDSVVAGGGGAGAQEPLTIKALASAPEETRKQMIGERLYALIEQQEPVQAGKITGMLLEMDTPELIHLLESEQALQEKIQEALQVLQTTTGDAGAADEKGDM